MTMDGSLRVLSFQFEEQFMECTALRCVAGVLRCATVGAEASDITDTYTVGVMPLAVCTHLMDSASQMHGSIEINDVVVSNTVEATLTVPTVNVCHRDLTSLWRCRAVYNDFINTARLLSRRGHPHNAYQRQQHYNDRQYTDSMLHHNSQLASLTSVTTRPNEQVRWHSLLQKFIILH